MVEEQKRETSYLLEGGRESYSLAKVKVGDRIGFLAGRLSRLRQTVRLGARAKGKTLEMEQ
jgi:hypothetical protein